MPQKKKLSQSLSQLDDSVASLSQTNNQYNNENAVSSCEFTNDGVLVSAVIGGKKYICEEKVGSGSFSYVYKGYCVTDNDNDNNNNAPVAIRYTVCNTPIRIRRELDILRLARDLHTRLVRSPVPLKSRNTRNTKSSNKSSSNNKKKKKNRKLKQDDDDDDDSEHDENEQQETEFTLTNNSRLVRFIEGGLVPNHRQDGGAAVMVMELLRHETLHEFLQHHGNELTVLDRLELLLETGKCLEEVHKEGCVHRDVKLGNFLFAMHNDDDTDENNNNSAATTTTKSYQHPQLRIIDFGLAFFESDQLEKDEINVGTLTYFAPEMAQNILALEPSLRKQPSRAADVWSFGIIMYGVFTLSSPYGNVGQGAKNERQKQIQQQQVIQNISNAKWNLPSRNEIVKSLPKEAIEMLTWILQKDANNRPTMMQVNEKLEELINRCKQHHQNAHHDENSKKYAFSRSGAAQRFLSDKDSSLSSSIFSQQNNDQNNQNSNNNENENENDNNESGVLVSAIIASAMNRNVSPQKKRTSSQKNKTSLQKQKQKQTDQEEDVAVSLFQQENKNKNKKQNKNQNNNNNKRNNNNNDDDDNKNIPLSKTVSQKIQKEETKLRTNIHSELDTEFENLFWLHEVQLEYAKHNHRFTKKILVHQDATEGFYCDLCTQRFDPPKTAKSKTVDYMHCSCGMDLCVNCATEHTKLRTCDACSKKFPNLTQLAQHQCSGQRRSRVKGGGGEGKEEGKKKKEKDTENNNANDDNANNNNDDNVNDTKHQGTDGFIHKANFLTNRSDVPDCLTYVMQPGRFGMIPSCCDLMEIHSCVLSSIEGVIFYIYKEEEQEEKNCDSAAATTNNSDQIETYIIKKMSTSHVEKKLSSDSCEYKALEIIRRLAVEDNSLMKLRRSSQLVSFASSPSQEEIPSPEQLSSTPLEYVREFLFDSESGCTVFDLGPGENRKQTLSNNNSTSSCRWELHNNKQQQQQSSSSSTCCCVVYDVDGNEKPLSEATSKVKNIASRLGFSS